MKQCEAKTVVFASHCFLLTDDFMALKEPNSPAEPPRRFLEESVPMRVEVRPSLAEPNSLKRRRRVLMTAASVRRRSRPADDGTLRPKLAAAELPAFAESRWNWCHCWPEQGLAHFQWAVLE